MWTIIEASEWRKPGVTVGRVVYQKRKLATVLKFVIECSVEAESHPRLLIK